jgi:hypothetical protein
MVLKDRTGRESYFRAGTGTMEYDLGPLLAGVFSELVDGATGGTNFVLNSGDPGLLASLDLLSAADASRSSQQGGTIAAHAEHLRYALSLMNRWAREGGNPFAGARWYEAWETDVVDEVRWGEIRAGLRHEIVQWKEALRTPRELPPIVAGGMTGSVVHLAYHMGAMRQIVASLRGPKDRSKPH